MPKQDDTSESRTLLFGPPLAPPLFLRRHPKDKLVTKAKHPGEYQTILDVDDTFDDDADPGHQTVILAGACLIIDAELGVYLDWNAYLNSKEIKFMDKPPFVARCKKIKMRPSLATMLITICLLRRQDRSLSCTAVLYLDTWVAGGEKTDKALLANCQKK